jgi:hypothetical protein
MLCGVIIYFSEAEITVVFFPQEVQIRKVGPPYFFFSHICQHFDWLSKAYLEIRKVPAM